MSSLLLGPGVVLPIAHLVVDDEGITNLRKALGLTPTMPDPNPGETAGDYAARTSTTLSDELPADWRFDPWCRAPDGTYGWWIGPNSLFSVPPGDPPESDAGRVAYNAYNAGGDSSTAGLNYQGLPCPAWEELPDNVRAKWLAAVEGLRVYATVVPELQPGTEYVAGRSAPSPLAIGLALEASGYLRRVSNPLRFVDNVCSAAAAHGFPIYGYITAGPALEESPTVEDLGNVCFEAWAYYTGGDTNTDVPQISEEELAAFHAELLTLRGEPGVPIDQLGGDEG